ncbi:MAG TPA: GAF domain-containing protein [Nitrospiria bacterium]|nr:GAF domain-containing protein [Nitrospiria bacterium]HUK56497.1 GAF domain-containing protein [Nitrospiria bacterium]
MDKPESGPDLFKKTREFLEIFRKGEEFTHDLLKENERLRYKIVQLEEEIKTVKKGMEGEGRFNELQEALEQLKEEKQSLLDRFKEVEAENKDFAEKYVEVEEENNNLANLYVASYQLHSTLDFNEVLRILQEIVINLVGADRFAILILDEVMNELTAVVAESVDEKRFRKIKVGDGVIGDVAKTGESYFQPDVEGFKPAHELDPIVCIPLKIKDRIIGILAIFSLLEQKSKKLNRVDYELFSMLAGHAATAIFSSKLYSVSERKLSTIQGFIDLLSGKGK